MDREDIIEIIKSMIAFGGLFFMAFMLFAIGG